MNDRAKIAIYFEKLAPFDGIFWLNLRGYAVMRLFHLLGFVGEKWMENQEGILQAISQTFGNKKFQVVTDPGYR